MRLHLAISLLIAAGLTGCTSNLPVTTTQPSPSPTPTTTKYVYNGTASVGDFLSITIDTSAKTISYKNLSNGDSGTAPYSVNSDGSYTITDPNGNLLAAYEVPGYALLIESAKSGPNKNTPALITAVESGQISMSTFANHNYNYIQFRTAAGGLEVGSVQIGSTTATDSSYWPYGNLNSMQNSPFNNSTMNFGAVTEDSSGTFMKTPDGGNTGGYDYIFGTSSGFFIVDTPNGSILGLQKAASKAFDPGNAGTYNAIFYQKMNANTGPGNVETGTASLGKAQIAITSNGGVTVTDSTGKVVTQATLTPIADASYLYGSAGQLADPCYGMFTFRVTTANSQQDVFVTFVGNSVVFASFGANLPWVPGGGTYNYQYGVGLK